MMARRETRGSPLRRRAGHSAAATRTPPTLRPASEWGPPTRRAPCLLTSPSPRPPPPCHGLHFVTCDLRVTGCSAVSQAAFWDGKAEGSSPLRGSAGRHAPSRPGHVASARWRGPTGRRGPGVENPLAPLERGIGPIPGARTPSQRERGALSEAAVADSAPALDACEGGGGGQPVAVRTRREERRRGEGEGERRRKGGRRTAFDPVSKPGAGPSRQPATAPRPGPGHEP